MKIFTNIYKSIKRKIKNAWKILPLKIRDNIVFAWFLAQSTLTVLMMAFFILIPIIIYPFLMGWPAPYCYIAYAFWISLLVGCLVFAAIIGYLRETQRENGGL
jgi:ABC-type transport system involved in multi-copper enzyme maturation permease subunit